MIWIFLYIRCKLLILRGVPGVFNKKSWQVKAVEISCGGAHTAAVVVT
jgi:hypothetical protein